MNDRTSIDLLGQTVKGQQTNVAGDIHGPVFSGQFNGPININVPKADEIARLPTIPDPPSDFTGRDVELKELQAKFTSGTNIIGLRGIGGVGKTTLAFKLAESLRTRYPDGHIMVDMRGTSDNPTTSLEAMGSIIHAYYPAGKIPDDEAGVKEIYFRLLSGKRALLLLDNALDDKQVLKLIPPKTCGLLVTSRRTIKLPGLYRKDLDVLKPDKALELLLNVWCSTPGSEKPPEVDPTWSDIARFCGFLPLALRAAASYLANSEDVILTEYAGELKDERTRLERIGETGVELGVDASFNLSFKKLDAKTQQIFLSASVFPADFDGQAEEQICQDEGHKGLSELLRWSFVNYKPLGTDYGRYKLHDLARLFALTRLSAELMQAVHRSHATYYKELLSLANSLYKEGGASIPVGLVLFDREETNIMAGQAWAEKNLETDSSAAQLCMSYPDAGPNVLDLRFYPRQKIAWLEIALSAARQLKDRSMEGIHLGNLGNAYATLGNARKAIEYYDQALAIAREIGDKRNENVWLGNLGNDYYNLGEPRKAIEYYDQALKISREIGNIRGEGYHLGNMGNVYSLLGNARLAIEYYERALKIVREIGDKRNEGIWLGDLGLVYYDSGDAHKAIEYYEHALIIAREIGDRWGEGKRLGNLGNAHAALGNVRKAIEYYEQALKISREIGDRRGEGIDIGNLGRAYFDLGEPHKAIEYNEQALKIAREIGDKRNESVWLSNLGNAYYNLGKPRKAIEYCEQALAIAREIGDQRGEGNALFSMSLSLDELGQRAKAIDQAKLALEIYEQIESPYADQVRKLLAQWQGDENPK